MAHMAVHVGVSHRFVSSHTLTESDAIFCPQHWSQLRGLHLQIDTVGYYQGCLSLLDSMGDVTLFPGVFSVEFSGFILIGHFIHCTGTPMIDAHWPEWGCLLTSTYLEA